jgi:aminoglycoside phosphotransferase (APT) family kinase protein
VKPLERLTDALSPGATPVSLRRLKGGLGARMHVLRYQTLEGERHTVVLRRSIPGGRKSGPDHTRYLFEVLRVLAGAGIPAPRPLLLDADGDYFGSPAIVLSYIPGKALLAHPAPHIWSEDLARAASSIHSVTQAQAVGLRQLPTVLEQVAEYADRARSGEPLARKALSVIEANAARIPASEACLVHNDYWPGNTVWRQGRLVAIIDWAEAGIGDRREDLAQCRCDLMFSQSLEVADDFLRCYQAIACAPVEDMWLYDLHRGLLTLLFYERWLDGYHDAGMHHLTSEDVGKRVRAFVQRALDEAL